MTSEGADGTPDYQNWRSLRELDEAAALAKGSAFRAFKRALISLREGQDFVVLDQHRDAALTAQLHTQQRLYRSSIHPVMVSPTTAASLLRKIHRCSDE